MRHVDFSPLYRSTVGFDRLAQMLDQVTGIENEGNSYPPYNIERLAEDRYQIALAVAGFAPEEISVTAEQNAVTIEGAVGEMDVPASDAGLEVACWVAGGRASGALDLLVAPAIG